jgi:hypothetical protein
MATAVYTTEEIILNDETTVVKLKPLSIKKMRQFMTVIDKMGDIKTESDGLQIFLEACEICIGDQVTEVELEDVLDLPTITHILDVCGGIKLSDPNLVLAAAALSGQSST